MVFAHRGGLGVSYHRKSCEISRDVYYQVKGILMGYDRMKRERLDLIYGAQYAISGMPHGSGQGDPTEQRAIKLAYINERLEAVDQAAVLMRAERGNKVGEDFDPIKAYWNYNYFNFQHKRTDKSRNGPCARTWNNFKDRFSAIIAENLKIF